MPAPEQLIRLAFPSDSKDHRDARLAVLRIFHAVENVDSEFHVLVSWLAYMIDSPVEGIFDGILGENCLRVADRLEVLASQLRLSTKTLSRLERNWRSFEAPQERGDEQRRDGDPWAADSPDVVAGPGTPF